MFEEVWKDVVGYIGYYQVSNKGNIRSLVQWNGHRYIERDQPYVLKQSYTTTGYKKVELTKNGNRKSKKVHRLVAKSFIPRKKGKDLINHKDGNPINNNFNNLEWCSQSENMIHAYKIGLIQKKIDENKEQQIIKDYFKGEILKEIEEKYNIEKTSVYRILKNNGFNPQVVGVRNNKYNINEHTLIKMLNKGKRNIDIAKHFNCPRQLIGVYKHNLKKEGKI